MDSMEFLLGSKEERTSSEQFPKESFCIKYVEFSVYFAAVITCIIIQVDN
jgi:hypothetical protein